MAEAGPQPNPPLLPADLPEPQAPQQPANQMVHLNWSHFRPNVSGKPDEDAEAHLLYTNDSITAHHFVEGVKVQRFA